MPSRKLIVIVGLPCSGKTTLGRKFTEMGYECVHSDSLRYSDNKWTRRPLAEYRRCVAQAISSAQNRVASDKAVVFESTCVDMDDPENARQVVLMELLLTQADTLIMFEPDDRFTCIARVIDRCIGQPQGSCPETSLDRAHLLDNFILHFNQNCETLGDVICIAKNAGLRTIRVPFGKDPKTFGV